MAAAMALALALVLALLLIFSSAAAQGQNFSFASFGSYSNDRQLILQDNATISASGGYIDLTNSNASRGPLIWNIGRVLYSQPVTLWPASFNTTFTIFIANISGTNSSNYGDGLAFCVRPDTSLPLPKSYGSFMGLFSPSTNGNTTEQLAVEFDTFMNEEGDPDNNHVGIDTKSIYSDSTQSLTPFGITLNSGRPIAVRITYDGWAHLLAVDAAYADSRRGAGDNDSIRYVRVLNRTVYVSQIVPRSGYIGFSSATGLSYETHRILNWKFSSRILPESSLPKVSATAGRGRGSGSGLSAPAKAGIVVGSVVAAAAVAYTSLWIALTKRRKRAEAAELGVAEVSMSYGPQRFNYKLLCAATRNFSETELLGSGGFGSVYRGIIDPTVGSFSAVLAVKRIAPASRHGERGFVAELSSIGRLRHRNLVPLLGWCHHGDELLLVYEYMPNGSLDRHIFAGTASPVLSWARRHKVLVGLASALVYLHEEWEQRVIHRDVKPSNVLLDADFNARLGDFGLARLTEHGESRQAISTVMAGTVGYVAPECGYTGKATAESDVFSFGIVALEVASGRRVGAEGNLVDVIWNLHGEGRLSEAADPRLHGEFDAEEMVRVLQLGLACSHPDPQLRPRIRQALHILMNPSEPMMALPPTRPMAIYVVLPPLPLLSSSEAGSLGSVSATGGSLTSSTLQYGR